MRDASDSAAGPLHEVAECTASWLTGILRQGRALCEGTVEAVQYEATSSTTATVAHLRLRYSAEARGSLPQRLFLKISDPRRLPNLPRDFVLGDARFYQRIRSVADSLPVALCYDAAVDEGSARFHVLLEDLSESHAVASVSSPPDGERCLLMMECFADFHAYWWNHPDLERFGGLPADDEPLRYVRSVQATLPGFLDAVGNRLPSEVRRLYEQFARDFGPAYASLFSRQRMTVIHGDAHPYNVLLPRQSGGPGRIVDWQFHHVSVCTQDIRHTLGLHWNEEARRLLERDMLRRYHQRLVARGVRGYSWDDCWQGYRVGVIDNLFMPMWQWTLDMPQGEWFPSIGRAVAAVKELGCHELLA